MKIGEVWKNLEDPNIKVRISAIEIDRVNKGKMIHFKLNAKGEDHFLPEHYFLAGFVQDHTAAMLG